MQLKKLYKIFICTSIIVLVLTLMFALALIKSKIGEFITGIGSTTITSVGIASTFTILLYRFVGKYRATKKEKISYKEILKQLEDKLSDVPIEYMEMKFVFYAGAIASYLKARGAYQGKYGKTGYVSYENWFNAVKKEAEILTKKYTKLKKRSYTLDLILKINPIYASETLEKFSHIYEEFKRIKFGYIPKKGLKTLASILRKYVRDSYGDK